MFCFFHFFRNLENNWFGFYRDEVIDKRGSKRKRTQIEVENYQRIAFWEDEDVSDAENEEDFEAAWDQNVTDNHNITLREDVYSDLRDEDEVENNNIIDLMNTEWVFFSYRTWNYHLFLTMNLTI